MTSSTIRQGDVHAERTIGTFNGFLTLAIALALVAGAAWLIVGMARDGRARRLAAIVGGDRCSVVAAGLLLAGLYTLQPNEARDPAALRRLPGHHARRRACASTNPFYTRRKISLRARNLNGERLKVNDKRGNPIEIAAVVVWRVEDTAKAFFDVDDYEIYVQAAGRGRGPPPRVVVRLRRGRQPPGGDTASRRCSRAPTSSPRRSSASCRRASTRPASSSRRRGSPTSPTPRRSRR